MRAPGGRSRVPSCPSGKFGCREPVLADCLTPTNTARQTLFLHSPAQLVTFARRMLERAPSQSARRSEVPIFRTLDIRNFRTSEIQNITPSDIQNFTRS